MCAEFVPSHPENPFIDPCCAACGGHHRNHAGEVPTSLTAASALIDPRQPFAEGDAITTAGYLGVIAVYTLLLVAIVVMAGPTYTVGIGGIVATVVGLAWYDHRLERRGILPTDEQLDAFERDAH